MSYDQAKYRLYTQYLTTRVVNSCYLVTFSSPSPLKELDTSWGSSSNGIPMGLSARAQLSVQLDRVFHEGEVVNK